MPDTTSNPNTTKTTKSGVDAILAAIARAALADSIAESLMMFPLAPQPGDTLDEHADGLRIAYAGEILRMLDAEAGFSRVDPYHRDPDTTDWKHVP
jgi:hypothetical protein